MFCTFLIGKEGQAGFGAGEGAQVVDAAGVVIVLVGENDTVKRQKVHTQHLLSKVRTAVNQETTSLVGFQQSTGTQSSVARVIGMTDGTGTTNLRNAHAGAGA